MSARALPAETAADDANDVLLMQLAGGGDVAAFEQLVERHRALVVGTVARMLGGSAEVEDIAQQVFIRVWRHAGRYVATAKFTTWLLKITRNLVFNELRRRKLRIFIPLHAEPDDEERPIPDTRGRTPERMLLDAELEDAIDRAIAHLPPNQRMAVVLRRYDDLSYEDIAEILGQTVPAVKSLLFRARTELRERLARYLA